MFSKILFKLANELGGNTKNVFLARVSNLLEEFSNTSVARSGTHKELKNLMRRKIFSILPESISKIENDLKEIFASAQEAQSDEEISSLVHNDLTVLLKYCLEFKEQSRKEELIQQFVKILNIANKSENNLFKAFALADAIAHDMVLWFCSLIEDVIESTLKSMGQSYERETDKFKKMTAPGKRSEAGIAKYPLVEYLGFIRKYGPKIGLGDVGLQEGSTDKGSKQLSYLLDQDPNLFGRVIKLIITVIHGGIKTPEKLNNVNLMAQSINRDLLEFNFPEKLKASKSSGKFTYTESDLDIRNESISEQDKIFLKDLKQLIDSEKIIPLKTISEKLPALEAMVLRTELEDSVKDNFARKIRIFFDSVSKEIPVIAKKEKSNERLKAISDSDYQKAMKPIRERKLALTKEFKDLVNNCYSEVFDKIMNQMYSNLESIAELKIRKELGLIK